MAIERWWKRIDAQSFTQDGNTGGDVFISDACLFKVKQQVVLSAAGQPDLTCEVHRICGPTRIMVGRKGRGIRDIIDVSAYTVAGGATIRAAEQKRPDIDWVDTRRATYEEEPTVAWRSFLVDKCGDGYTKTNPLPVDASVTTEVDLELPDKKDIQNITVANANTEFPIDLPDNTKCYTVKVRDGEASARLGCNSGDTDTNDKYIKLRRGTSFNSPSVDLPLSSKLYFQASKANVVVEVISWYKS